MHMQTTVGEVEVILPTPVPIDIVHQAFVWTPETVGTLVVAILALVLSAVTFVRALWKERRHLNIQLIGCSADCPVYWDSYTTMVLAALFSNLSSRQIVVNRVQLRVGDADYRALFRAQKLVANTGFLLEKASTPLPFAIGPRTSLYALILIPILDESAPKGDELPPMTAVFELNAGKPVSIQFDPNKIGYKTNQLTEIEPMRDPGPPPRREPKQKSGVTRGRER